MTYVLIIHLLCAVVFVGYVFADAILCSSKGFAGSFKRSLSRAAAVIMAGSFVLLIASGGLLAWEEFASFSHLARVMFEIKMALLLIMLALTAVAIWLNKFGGKKASAGGGDGSEQDERGCSELNAQNERAKSEQDWSAGKSGNTHQASERGGFLLAYAHYIALGFCVFIVIFAKLIAIF